MARKDQLPGEIKVHTNSQVMMVWTFMKVFECLVRDPERFERFMKLIKRSRAWYFGNSWKSQSHGDRLEEVFKILEGLEDRWELEEGLRLRSDDDLNNEEGLPF